MITRFLVLWGVLCVAAIANGIARQTLYADRLGDLTAHQLSTVILIVVFGVIIRAASRRWPLGTPTNAWTVGGLWLVMTMTFEFLFGHYVAGHPWSRLLQDYNLAQGRLWALVLLWILIAPRLFITRTPS